MAPIILSDWLPVNVKVPCYQAEPSKLSVILLVHSLAYRYGFKVATTSERLKDLLSFIQQYFFYTNPLAHHQK